MHLVDINVEAGPPARCDEYALEAAGVSTLDIAFAVSMTLEGAGSAAAFGPVGRGGTERMTAYPAMRWLLAFGGYLLGASERSTDPRRSA